MIEKPAPQDGRVVNNVLFGTDGWQFLWQGAQRQFDFLLGELTPDYSSVENFVSNIENRASFCSQLGIKYLHLVYPSKPVVMPEFLPGQIGAKVNSLFERCFRSSLGKNENLILYPLSLLEEKKQEIAVYQKKDTHLSDTGNIIVAKEVFSRLGEDHDPFPMLRKVTRPHRGDLSAMAGLDDRSDAVFWELYDEGGHIWDNRPFLQGNSGNVLVSHNINSVSNQRLLAIGDSFLKNSVVPMSTYYRDILYIRSDLFQYDAIELFCPDVIITSNAERYLSKVDSDENARSILFQTYDQKNYSPDKPFTEALRAQLGWKAYSAQYSKWAKSLKPPEFGELGVGRVNNQVDLSEYASGEITSKGRDPQISFSGPDFDLDQAFDLEIFADYSEGGTAQLYYLFNENQTNEFSELHSQRIAVTPGRNRLSFEVPAGRSGNALRFDPLDCPGKLKIISCSLHIPG